MGKKHQAKRKEQYKSNKSAKVGETIVCPICGTSLVKRQWQQAFCCTQCKDKYWNDKPDRHREGYYHDYNVAHPERLERIGVYKDDFGKLGYYDDDGNFYTFEEDYIETMSCEDPIEGR